MDDGRRAVSDEPKEATTAQSVPPPKPRAAHTLKLDEYPNGSIEQEIEHAIDEQLTRVYRDIARQFPHVSREQGHGVWLQVLAAHLASGAYKCCKQPAHLEAVMMQTRRYWLRLQMTNEGVRVPAGTRIQ